MRKARVLILLVLCGATLCQGCATGNGAAVAYDRRTLGTMIDDELIEFKVVDAFRKDPELWKQSHLNATSFNHVVLLTGETPNEDLRTRAVGLVQQIPKVRKVHNEVAIAAPSSILSRSGDTWITGKVKTNLLTADQSTDARVKVVTENGTVYLMGLVTREEADGATDLARTVSGVQRVVKIFEYVK